MNIDLLKQIGLTDSQAKTYLALVEAGQLTPQELAKNTGEARTTAYMALDKLKDIGLARLDRSRKGKVYEPSSPSALHMIIEKRRAELDAVEGAYKNSLSELMDYYFNKRNKPGVKFYEGMDGLQEIYKDHLRNAESVKILRTPADEGFGKILYEYMDKRAALGITAEILGPALPGVIQYSKQHNTRLKRINYWCPVEAYNAPVEISIYGDRVSMISFGDEAIGLIIESPQIAASLGQLYELAKVGAKKLVKDAKLPVTT